MWVLAEPRRHWASRDNSHVVHAELWTQSCAMHGSPMCSNSQHCWCSNVWITVFNVYTVSIEWTGCYGRNNTVVVLPSVASFYHCRHVFLHSGCVDTSSQETMRTHRSQHFNSRPYTSCVVLMTFVRLVWDPVHVASFMRLFVYSMQFATWLILPVVICLSQGLSHACLSISLSTTKLRTAH